ncbi:hypothetical protein KGF56_000356 [Candida oxycetoniae]|uniref:Uncharacterized protein n=1 Tax=Candida oxycetoniae TaxID=497107 RepID=A0AAI9T1T7_9ASCO|nr:uncharacterized protein KGF56_000356 [Candida oxycetoniae]KAI3406751.2 hypothetical protein KGF56_000356 [Candida oxycetoniae]
MLLNLDVGVAASAMPLLLSPLQPPSLFERGTDTGGKLGNDLSIPRRSPARISFKDLKSLPSPIFKNSHHSSHIELNHFITSTKSIFKRPKGIETKASKGKGEEQTNNLPLSPLSIAESRSSIEEEDDEGHSLFSDRNHIKRSVSSNSDSVSVYSCPENAQDTLPSLKIASEKVTTSKYQVKTEVKGKYYEEDDDDEDWGDFDMDEEELDAILVDLNSVEIVKIAEVVTYDKSKRLSLIDMGATRKSYCNDHHRGSSI